MNANKFEHLLYKRRPDLWAVSKVLIHCKGTAMPMAVWQELTVEEKACLTDVSAGKLPELLSM